MTLTLHVYIASSLDGFIARDNGGIDWLKVPDLAGEEHGFDAFIGSVDGLIMGRGTFETVIGFGKWPYPVPGRIISGSLTESDVPEALRPHVILDYGSPAEVLARAEAAGWSRAYLDGGQLIQSFIRDGLVADMIITRLPVLLGQGRPLFGHIPRDIWLTHHKTQSFPSGLVQSHYRLPE